MAQNSPAISSHVFGTERLRHQALGAQLLGAQLLAADMAGHGEIFYLSPIAAGASSPARKLS